MFFRYLTHFYNHYKSLEMILDIDLIDQWAKTCSANVKLRR